MNTVAHPCGAVRGIRQREKHHLKYSRQGREVVHVWTLKVSRSVKQSDHTQSLNTQVQIDLDWCYFDLSFSKCSVSLCCRDYTLLVSPYYLSDEDVSVSSFDPLTNTLSIFNLLAIDKSLSLCNQPPSTVITESTVHRTLTAGVLKDFHGRSDTKGLWIVSQGNK